MLKLYDFEANPPRYWETWANQDGTHTVHWGTLGSKGEAKTIKRRRLQWPRAQIRREALARKREGFKPIDVDDHSILQIEYAVDGFGNVDDLDKRYRLQERMDQTLGWTGLGHCDGGSIGSGTMEVCCFVVDFALARDVIAADLAETEFRDFTRIYEEGAE